MPSETSADAVAEKLAALEDLDGDVDDPTVLLQRGADDVPCVARVGDDLRMLSSRVIYARPVTEVDVRVAWDTHGEPDLVALSTQSHRFDADDFREVAGCE